MPPVRGPPAARRRGGSGSRAGARAERNAARAPRERPRPHRGGTSRVAARPRAGAGPGSPLRASLRRRPPLRTSWQLISIGDPTPRPLQANMTSSLDYPRRDTGSTWFRVAPPSSRSLGIITLLVVDETLLGSVARSRLGHVVHDLEPFLQAGDREHAVHRFGASDDNHTATSFAHALVCGDHGA